MSFLLCLLMILTLQTCNRQAGGQGDGGNGCLTACETGCQDDAPATFTRVLEAVMNEGGSVPASNPQEATTAGEVADVLTGDVADVTTGELALRIAKAMVGTEYVAGTLEHEPERLRVNLDSTDCILFVELCCSFALAVKSGEPSYGLLVDNIRQMRYRGGVVDGYASRIHYTSEWLAQNASRGVLDEITAGLGGVPLDQTFDFMSTHPDSYAQFRDNPSNVALIAGFEEALNRCEYFYLPQPAISSADIRDGDIICFISKVKGLDISHVALACEVDGRMCFIHASSAAGKVIIDSRTIAEYARNGIRVARLR